MPEPKEYQVLARKYRPRGFEDLIGQEGMVQTLTNAIKHNRLAQAYILTGIRGVGKTTTARIIAKALNGRGINGESPPTINPDPQDENVKAIEEGRHVDVLEMDAASRTGVNDIREIIDTVPYRPVLGAYKIYIIDEVHMLSNNAFNALLKTLEEPPPHVKFIFATTEIRKVPITVLSRCQRFDLKRVDVDVLKSHIEKITALENGEIEDEAARLVARAADGSVRDALSLLDQALVIGNQNVTAALVSDMLGLMDKNQIYDLLSLILKAQAQESITLFDRLYQSGADPLLLLQDLLESIHFLTRLKITPQTTLDTATPIEKSRGQELIKDLQLSHLSRHWQILLKGIEEIKTTHDPKICMEMILIRLCHAQILPTLEEMMNHDSSASASSAERSGAPVLTPPSNPAPRRAASVSGSSYALSPQPQKIAPPSASSVPQSFLEIVELLENQKEARLASLLIHEAYLVDYKPGRLVLRLKENVDAAFPGQLAKILENLTGTRFVITLTREGGEKTLDEQRKDLHDALIERLKHTPQVARVLEAFPQAEIVKITPKGEST